MTSRTTFDGTTIMKYASEEPTPDPALNKWAEWVAKRRQIYNNLAKISNQPVHCIVENVGRQFTKVSDQNVIEEAQKYQEARKPNAHPKWFTTVSKCKDACQPTVDCLTYPSDIKFEDDPNVLRKRPYFGVPETIALDDGLGTFCERKSDRKWSKSTYLARRKEELKENIDVLEDFRPDINGLYVKGKKIGHNPNDELEDQVKVPSIVVKPPAVVEESYEISSSSLRICNVIIGTDYPETLEFQWLITFPSTDLGQSVDYVVQFQNVGSSAIRFHWVPAPIVDGQISSTRHNTSESCFDLDTKEEVLIPGEELGMKFKFSPYLYGVFTKVWKLETYPNLRPTPILFTLQGIGSEEQPQCNLPWFQIEENIQKSVRDSTVNKILDEIEKEVFIPKLHTLDADMYQEDELFELNNPPLRYKTEGFTSLNEINSMITGKNWDFSVSHLRDRIFENVTTCEDMNSYIKELNGLVSELTSSIGDKRNEDMKYSVVYTLLCTFFNRMEAKADRMLPKESQWSTVFSAKESKRYDDVMENWMASMARTDPEEIGTKRLVLHNNKRKSVASVNVPFKKVSTLTDKEKKGTISTEAKERRYIRLMKTPKNSLSFESQLEQSRDFFTRSLEFYTRELLDATLDRIFAAIDAINFLESGKTGLMPMDSVPYRGIYGNKETVH